MSNQDMSIQTGGVVTKPMSPRERKYAEKYGVAALKRMKALGARLV